MQAAARGGRVVVDEVSMLGHKDAVKLFELARKTDLKLIFVGDPMQHGAVARGALMRILKDMAASSRSASPKSCGRKTRTTGRRRSCSPKARRSKGFDAIDGMGWIKEIADDDDRYRHIAADYLQALR